MLGRAFEETLVMQHGHTRMVHFFIFAGLLKDVQDLGRAIKSAVNLLFPTATAARINESLNQQGVVPSAAGISRFRFLIDAVYMMWMRQLFQRGWSDNGGWTVYMLADASPVGGREWFLAEAYMMHDSTLEHVFDASNGLIHSRIALENGSPEFPQIS